MRCRESALRLEARGHTLRVVTGKYAGPDNPSAVAGGFPSLCSPALPAELLADHAGSARIFREISLSWGPPYPPEELAAFLESEIADREAVARHIERFKPDVVSVWGMEFASQPLIHWLASTGVPLHAAIDDVWLESAFERDPLCQVTQTAHDLGIAVPPALRPLLNLGLQRPGIPPAGVLFVSEFLRRRCAASGFDAAAANARWGGVDLSAYRSSDRAPRAPLDADQPARILFVGRVGDNRGIRDLIAACARIVTLDRRAVALRVVGECDRSYADELQSALPDGLRIEFIGALPPDRLPAEYQAAHLLVAPSRLPEGMSRVTVEALACGTPVIVSDSGAQRELVRDTRYGRVFAAGDAQALHAEMRATFDDYDAALRTAAAGRDYAFATFDPERYIEVLEEHLQHVATTGRPPNAARISSSTPSVSAAVLRDFVHRCGRAACEHVSQVTDPVAAWRLGVLLKRTGRNRPAERVFARLLDECADDPASVRRATFHLGEIALINGMWESASEWFERCLRVAPNHAKAAYDADFARRCMLPAHLSQLVRYATPVEPALR